MKNQPSAILVYALLLACCAPDGPILLAAEQPPIYYETAIAPVFQKKCARCHGPQTQEGGLDLVVPAGLISGGDSGPGLNRKKPLDSLVWEKIAEGEMPPEDEEPLTKLEIEQIRNWLSSGAKFREPVSVSRKLTQHDVIPTLLLRCTACHGVRRKEANLDLRTKASILKGGKSGPVVVPGKPEASLLIQRIVAEEMPPRRKLVSVSVKPMTPVELKRLEEWIRQGLPEAEVVPAKSTPEIDTLVREKDRQFWSFQPPKPVAIPHVEGQHRVRTPVDAFILRKLESSGISLSDEAEKLTLLRRISVDLIGLLPTPTEIDAFLTDQSPAAYEQLVDRLLASPRYGERWGRHWLDAAGYADSEGAQNEDRVRPHMYRYRDYVIQSMNANTPYDRFLTEQLAGDELADYERADEITPEIYNNIVATGFLRTAPDRTFANITNFVPDRLEVIADEVQIFGSAILGLTIQCARCHTHKFDPLPQRDYYRLAAIFKDAYDEHDWLKSQGPRTLPFVTTIERKKWEDHQQALKAEIAPIKKRLDAEPDVKKKKPLQQQIDAINARKKPEPKIRALWSRGEPSPTYLLKRGNYLKAGQPVEPGVPSVLNGGVLSFSYQRPWQGAKQTGRRLALARWLTQPGHPLTARVMVNRIWKHHFGTGIVETLDNFGTTGAKPTHPELLDWLATEFVRSGWNVKHLHRLIVTSSVYRQSSTVSSENLQADPDGRLVSRMPLSRMEAEVLRDSLLQVSGQLDFKPFGPADAVDVRGDGLVTSQRNNRGWRRSIYVLQRRTKIPTLLENFDFPQMGPNCLQRSESIVALQALHLMNNKMIGELAGHFAERVRLEVGEGSDQQINQIYRTAIGRPPTAEERQLGLNLLEKFQKHWLAELGSDDKQPTASQRALVTYCHAILNSAAFLYID